MTEPEQDGATSAGEHTEQTEHTPQTEQIEHTEQWVGPTEATDTEPTPDGKGVS